jgi:hypothetical protein
MQLEEKLGILLLEKYNADRWILICPAPTEIKDEVVNDDPDFKNNM